ncbi:uncharacterized protein LOC126897724 [Daktulosphaira vitifoliae]|uniref:uncharacterized protein LOC126897724 n=1 Tax=Daktulosphaira vitifoliae TaxID=58002 RepID=UPI0021AA09CF|nr:uncharacterized protein LOC126897724 [Daktulosphaira vitifoliae]XP_050527495.1 uncharacterized protein LOC126897724 [Daktulosphaira vitifoliae]
MIIFSVEYIPEISWNIIETNHEGVHEINKNKNRGPLTFPKIKSNSKVIQDKDNASVELLIKLIIKSIDEMIDYNKMCYSIIEKKTQQLDLEIKVLTNILQNLYDIKNNQIFTMH